MAAQKHLWAFLRCFLCSTNCQLIPPPIGFASSPKGTPYGGAERLLIPFDTSSAELTA